MKHEHIRWPRSTDWFTNNKFAHKWSHEPFALAEPGALRANSPPSRPFDGHAVLAVVLPDELRLVIHKACELARFQQLTLV